MASKKTIQNQIQKLSEQLRSKPYEIRGWIFSLDDPDTDFIDHRAEQLRLGFTQSAKESESFHLDHSHSEFLYLGDDYLEFIGGCKD